MANKDMIDSSVWDSGDATFEAILKAWVELLASLGTTFEKGYRDPVSESDLAAAQQKLGFEFHPDVKTFYRMSDGFQFITPGHGGGVLLPNGSQGTSLHAAAIIYEGWHDEENLILATYEEQCDFMTPETAANARKTPPQNVMPVMQYDEEGLLAYGVECTGPRAGAVFGIGTGWVAPSLSELFRRAHRFYRERRCHISVRSLWIDPEVETEYLEARHRLGLPPPVHEYYDLLVTLEDTKIKKMNDLYAWRW